MKQLIENQMKEFREKFLSENNAGQICWSIEGIRTEMVIDWHKQSFKQFIDELIEREESKKKDEWNIQDEFIESHAEYNEAKRESIAHLKEIKENLTN